MALQDLDALKTQTKVLLQKKMVKSIAEGVRKILPNARSVWFKPGVEYNDEDNEYYAEGLNAFDENGVSLLGIDNFNYMIDDSADYTLITKVFDTIYNCVEDNDFAFVYGSEGAHIVFDKEVTIVSQDTSHTGQELFKENMQTNIKSMIRYYYPEVDSVNVNRVLDYVDGVSTANTVLTLISKEIVHNDCLRKTEKFEDLLAEFDATFSVPEFYFAFNGRVAEIDFNQI